MGDLKDPADSTVGGMSLVEKVRLGSGASFWSTHPVGPLPPVRMTDGPHGVRSQTEGNDHLGFGASAPATCFPPSAALAQTWDTELVGQVAGALGRECQDLGVDVLLAPGINIKRDPRCGRNFEYFSEDPHLTGVLAGAYVDGVQREGVGTSLKHFAANNAETDRMRASSEIDDRTMREIYLRAFERVVTTAQPWTVMAAYNKVNGVFATENEWLLTKVLREEWGFEGLVVSDWGAVGDRPCAVAAGLDLQMPGSAGSTDDQVLGALEAGTLSQVHVDRAARKVAELALRASRGRRGSTTQADAHRREHHALAREAAARAIVLLKNDEDLLPLTGDEPIAVIGPFAAAPRIQGGGSSRVNATQVDVPLDELRSRFTASVTFAEGYAFEDVENAASLRTDAASLAAAARCAIVFLGLDDRQESEGYDRTHIDLPEQQLALLRDVVVAQPRTIVVLVHGGVVRLDKVADLAPAILDTTLLGQGGGAAVADVLLGRVNPSGRLAETVPMRIEDVPSYLSFPGEAEKVRYSEGLFVGYRWYDARDAAVAFPFGHGLSYTQFEYSSIRVTSQADGLQVSLDVTNVGPRTGREVVQVYAGLPTSELVRPVRELKAFVSVEIAAGQTRRVELLVERHDLAVWHPLHSRWYVEGGAYSVAVGASSRDLRLTAEVDVVGDVLTKRLSLDSTMGDLLDDPRTADAVAAMMSARSPESSSLDPHDNELGMDVLAMVRSIPVGRLVAMRDSDEARALIALISELSGVS